jgi:hypothetical protein
MADEWSAKDNFLLGTKGESSPGSFLLSTAVYLLEYSNVYKLEYHKLVSRHEVKLRKHIEAKIIVGYDRDYVIL